MAGHAPACLPINLRAYVELVEWTGKQVRPGKRGALSAHAPSALARYGDDPERWTTRVKAVGCGYWRVIGAASDLIDAARRLNQHWVKGIGLARALEQTTH